MITLAPNSSEEQFIYLTLQEAKQDTYAMVGNVDADNARYTKLSVLTNQPLGASGRVLLTESGQYTYDVYGQNSSSNLSASDASVVGLIERGTLTVTGETGYTIPSITIPDNVIYYE
jgi:VCBS repeat-containing protein